LSSKREGESGVPHSIKWRKATSVIQAVQVMDYVALQLSIQFRVWHINMVRKNPNRPKSPMSSQKTTLPHSRWRSLQHKAEPAAAQTGGWLFNRDAKEEVIVAVCINLEPTASAYRVGGGL
jgi:hypothetical protein